jgi:hypothetical protein
MYREESLRVSGLLFCGGAESVASQLGERRTYGGVSSSTSKRWIPAVRRTSSRGDPKRVERYMAVLVNVFLRGSHGINTMSPSCARRAPAGSKASLVHYYGQPTACRAPACLHAAACADRNSVTLSPQLWEGREAVRGAVAASPNVVCEAPAPCAPARAARPAQPSNSGP